MATRLTLDILRSSTSSKVKCAAHHWLLPIFSTSFSGFTWHIWFSEIGTKLITLLSTYLVMLLVQVKCSNNSTTGHNKNCNDYSFRNSVSWLVALWGTRRSWYLSKRYWSRRWVPKLPQSGIWLSCQDIFNAYFRLHSYKCLFRGSK